MTSQPTIAIVDDDEAVRDSLDALIRAAGHETELYENASDFLAVSDSCEMDCVLLDVRLPDIEGLDVLQRLIRTEFSKPVIMMTGHGDVPMAVKAMRLGAKNFVQKPFDADALLNVIDDALGADEIRQQQAAKAEAARRQLEKLTARESDVMRHLVIGRQNKVIARELGLSPRTVEIHRARVMEKTGAQSLSHLVRMAITAGLNLDE